MKSSFRETIGRDSFVSGAALIAIAAVFLWSARNYPAGSLASMGPGYFPNALCWILVAVGLAIIVNGKVEDAVEEPRGKPRLLPVFLIPLSYCVFAFTVERGGLLVASTALTLLAAFAFPNRGKFEAVVVTICLLLMASVLWYLIGLQVPLFPGER
jgi:hypothetical protein